MAIKSCELRNSGIVLIWSLKSSDVMKLFQSVQKYYRTLGVYAPQSNQNYAFNWRNLVVLFALTQGFIFTMAFCLLQAKTVREYGDSFYVSVTEFADAIYFLSNIWKMRKFFKLIEQFENFIEKSKSKNVILHLKTKNIISSQNI